MVSALISRVVILVFGTLYPAYSSYKAVKNKNVKEYVKWMMYWIVFALFTTVETFADVLVSWFPFYYEMKIVFVIWLLSPATKGSSVLYRKFVHPELMKREEEIDVTIDKVKTQGYSALVNVGQQGLNYAVQSAMTGQTKVLDHLMKKSFSMNDISNKPRQQQASAVTFHTRSDQIVEEECDEPDSSCQVITANVQASQLDEEPRLEVSQMHRGSQQEEPDSELRNVEEIDSETTHRRGYHLRSHEYHGESSSSRDRQQCSRTEGHNYGTLPRRSASMRSNVNTALPSRWRKSSAQ